MQKVMVFFLLALLLTVSACSKESGKTTTRDPLETYTYDYLNKIKASDWDGAFAMLSEETQKYYPKKDYIKYAKSFIQPKVDAVYVTKIEKAKLDATIYTKFKPKTSWATYNSMVGSLITVKVVYKNAKWYVTYEDVVMKAKEEEVKTNERLARVGEWKAFLKLLEFKVENKITDNGPKLVVHGEIENIGTKECELVMVMVKFLDHKGESVYSVVLIPIYLSKYKEGEALKSGKTQKFVETISSEIPDTWTGKISYELYDAGVMPNKR